MAHDRDVDGDGERGREVFDSPAASSDSEVQNEGFSRRGFLIGGGASVVAASVAEANEKRPYLDVTYEDRTRRGLIVAWHEPGSNRERYAWTLRASNFTDPELPEGRGRFVLRRTHEGWRADIADCALPGGYQFGLRLEVKWDPAFLAKTPKGEAPSLRMTLRRGASVRLDLPDLVGFLKAEDASKKVDEIAGDLTGPQLQSFAELFGNSFDVSRARNTKIAFHREFYWILRGGRKLEPSEVESSSERQSRFFALRDEGVSLPFREVFFTVFSGSTGTKPADVFILNPNAKDRERQDVRALFAGDGAPPAPDSTLSEIVVGQSNDARAPAPPEIPARRQLPDGPGLADNPRERAARERAEQRLSPRVLYALVRHDLAQTKAYVLDAWSGTLFLGRHSAGERANLSINEGKEASFLGWRNQGDANPVFALRAPSMTLSLQREQSAVPSQFDDLSGLLWRARAEDRRLRVIASLTPTKRKMRIETRYGRFSVAPLPPIAPRPGVSGRVPPIRIGGTGPKDTRALNHFATPVALEEASIPLGSQRRADTASQSAVQRAARLFSQLTFYEAECLFHIDKLPRRHVWKGVPAPSSEPPQAEAVIHIGATKSNNELPSSARLSLSPASLLVRRPSDLLALKYRFQDLLLEFGEAGWWVVPDRRIAAFVHRSEPKPDAGVTLICGDKPLLANDPSRYDSRRDSRPLLVVEFPPQHIAERAYLRQLQAEPTLPAPPTAADGSSTEASAAEAEVLRNGTFSDRKIVRSKLAIKQKSAGNLDYDEFVESFRRAVADENAKKATIPDDQAVYVGAAYLDVEAARVARRVARGIQTAKDWTDTVLQTADERARVLRSLPEVVLPPISVADLRKELGVPDDLSEGYPEPIDSHPAEGDVKKYLDKREELREQRDPDYEKFRDFYASIASKRKQTVGLTDKERDAIDAYPSLPGPFYGRRSTIARVELIAKTDLDAARKAVRAIAATVNAYDLHTAIDEPFQVPTEARVSGPSRLVFRIPADDFEGGRPDAHEGAPAGAFPFTIEALTNWGSFDLAVVKRAEKVFEPLSGVKGDRQDGKGASGRNNVGVGGADDQEIVNGRFPPRWARQETRDEAARLLYQGLTRGDAWSLRHDEKRALDKLADCPVPLARIGFVTGAQRMAEIAASAQPATLFETSIELPFRLMLSPSQDVMWRTPLGLPATAQLAAATDAGARTAPVPLWFAQLDEAPGSASVRAIWSPDFRPEALLDNELGAPPHGPWAPWAMAREVTSRRPYEAEEDVYQAPGQPKGPKKRPEQFRTGLDVADRHELVALSSLYGLPVRGRRKENGALADGSQINPPPGFKLRYAELEKPNKLPEDDYSAIYRPQPLGVDELTLTALGGSLDADTSFVPPASAKVIPVGEWIKSSKSGRPLFDAFSIERWRQNTRLGRDIRVEVVYKGFLFPVGHRASLVKLTERRFMAGPGGLAAGPVAFLVQRFFLRVGSPIKTYPALGHPNGGRRWPVERLEILTRVTPDILDPANSAPSSTEMWSETSNGRIYLRESTGNPSVLPGLVFWPRVQAREGGEVNFELQIDGRGARARLPLIFVDNTAANDEKTMKVLVEEYSRLKYDSGNDTTAVDARRILQLGGGKRRYAPEKEPDGTSFETVNWVIEAEGGESQPPQVLDETRRIQFTNTNYDFGALLQGVDQPPFYPVMAEGAVRIAQVERLVGRSTDQISVFFDAEYQAFGFPDDKMLKNPSGGPTAPFAKTDVYLDFRDPVILDPGASGDRTGGAARPNTRLVGVSRTRGPVGNNNYKPAIAQARAGSVPPVSTGLDKPKPEKFFGDATILGILDLGKAITFLVGGMSSAPQFNEVAQYTSALLADLKQGSDAGAAVAKVRDRLLIPMREALLTVARQFFEAVKQDSTAVFDEDIALARIERLYPDVGSSYRELRNALEEAISSSEASRDVEALLASFAIIYGAGRRFVAAIERVASDPLAPVHEALREAFNKFIGDVIARAGSLVESAAPELEELKQFALKLRDSLTALLFANADLRSWRHMVFAMPGGHAIAQTYSAQVEAVDRKVEEILAKVASVSEADFLGTLLTKNPVEAAKLLSEGFDSAMRQAIRDASGDFRKALELAYQDWKVAVGNEVDQEAKRIQGLMYEAAAGQLRALLMAAAKLAEQEKPSIRTVINDLTDAAAAVADLIRPMLDEGLAKAVDWCGKLATIVKSVIDAVNLPSSSDLDTAKTSMGTAFDAAATAVSKVGIDPKEVTDIKDALEKDVNDLIKVRDALGRALSQLLQLQSDVCSNTPQRLPLDAFAALGRIRSTLLDEVHGFIAGLASPHFRATDLKSLLAKITGTSSDADLARIAVINATKAASSVVIALCKLVRDATALRDTAADGALKKVRDDLSALGNPRLNHIIARIDNAKSDAISLKGVIDTTIQTLEYKANEAVTAPGAQKYLDELLAIVITVPDIVDSIKSRMVQMLEEEVLQELGAFLIAGEPYLRQVVLVAFQALRPVFKFLTVAQTELVAARKKVWEALGGSSRDGGGGTPIGDELSQLTFAKVRGLLLVTCKNALPWPGLTCSATPNIPDDDFLTTEKVAFEKLLEVFSSADPTKLDKVAFDTLTALLRSWNRNEGSTQRLIAQLADAATAVLSGDLKRIVDLESARRRIEEKIKELVPAKILLNYDLTADLKDFPPSGKPIFLPRPGSQITLSAGAVYNLLEPTVPPRFRASCRLDPFDINLFDVVTLMFDSAQFVNESGKGSDFDIVYKDFELGPNAAFLKPLQALMNPGGSGPYVRPSREVPGIEAGYSLDLGIISIGTVSFMNVSINASCVLPFNNARATFVASIGREDAPVLLSIAPYVGGGFLALYADATRLIGFAASFEFGGGGAFKFGPLSGQGRLATGIYLRKLSRAKGEDDCVIEGFFYAGGEAHVACFAISATLVVRISHRQGGSMQGSAVFTFSFSIGFAKLRYQVGVQKNMGSGFSGSRSASALITQDLRVVAGNGLPPAAVVSCGATAQQDDWLTYQTYFSDDIIGFPK